jgi:hypothetical protein
MKLAIKFAAFALFSGVAVAQTSAPKKNFVFDEKTAIRIAEARLVHLHGEDYVKQYEPLHATLSEGIWTVRPTMPRGMTGGGFGMKISQKSGTIIGLVEFQ